MSEKDRSFAVAPVIDRRLGELVRPCGDDRRPKKPQWVAGEETLAVTFSGGGFRATLAALGVLQYLADAGLLANVRYMSSVSGGSIANGMLACRWGELRDRGFTSDAVDELLVEPVVDSISGSSLKWELVRNLWRTIGRPTRTDLLARAFQRRFFAHRTLDSLDPQCRWIVNAANLTTGVRFAFERDVLGDYVTGLAPTQGSGVRVSQAVAASAAVPGAFAPWRLRRMSFPCPPPADPYLLDGGVYDNTGLTALDSDAYRDAFFVSLNAGGVFVMGRPSRLPVLGQLLRAESVLYRQSTALRTSWMVERFHLGAHPTPGGSPMPARRGVLFALSSTLDVPSAWTFPEIRDWEGRDLAFVKTSFDRFDRSLCRRLVYRGWWLAGACLATYYPTLARLPKEAPPDH